MQNTTAANAPEKKCILWGGIGGIYFVPPVASEAPFSQDFWEKYEKPGGSCLRVVHLEIC